MTKHEVIEKCGQSIYAIWLNIAIRHFDARDPEGSFEIAKNFVQELLKQNPEF